MNPLPSPTPQRRGRRGQGTVRLRSPGRYQIRYVANGRRYVETIGAKSEAEAVRYLQRRLAEREHEGARFLGPQAERVTYADLMELVRVDYDLRKRRSYARVQYARLHLDAAFGSLRAVDVTEQRLDAYWSARRAAGAADATVRNELNVLRHGYTLALRKHIVRQVPTFPSMAHVARENVRNVFFSRAEFERLRDALPAPLRGPVVFAWHTAWRLKSEVLRLEWSRVNLATGVIRLQEGTTKNGDGRTIVFRPIAELAAMLDAQRAYVSQVERATGRIIPWVFCRATGERVKDFREAWDAACLRAGLVDGDGKPSKVPHDLRRSGIRNLERAGVSRSAAKKMVGHRSSAVFDRYADASVADADIVEAAAQLGALHCGDSGNSGVEAPGQMVFPLRKVVAHA